MLRSRVALAQGRAEEASVLAQQAIVAARRSPSTTDRGVLSFWAFAAAGNASGDLGQSDQARAQWSSALQSLPKGIELRPRELAAIAAIKMRLGDRAGAQKLALLLDSMGYRHSATIAALKGAGGTQ